MASLTQPQLELGAFPSRLRCGSVWPMLPLRPAFMCSLIFVASCGDDGGGSATTSASSGSATDGSSTGTNSGTATLSTSSDTEPVASETSVADTAGTSTGPGADTTAADSGTTSDTAGFDCTAVPAGPFDAEPILEDVPFAGSEDLAFDGQGHLAARGTGNAYLLVNADGTYEEITTDNRATYGLRYLANGDLVAAAFMANDILRITPGGDVSSFIDNVGGVNGLFPDSLGGVWYTNFSEVGYVDSDGNDVSVIPGASGANGIFFDESRQIIFFTNYSSGALRKSVIVDNEPQAPVTIGTIDGAPDGITLDECGNLYAVDQGNADLYRVMLDEAADPLGEPELLVAAGFPSNVANAQFGSGTGWDADALYVLGVGGGLYRVAVGVPGAPYVTVR